MPGLTSSAISSSLGKALCSRAKDTAVCYGGLHPAAGCPLTPCAPLPKNSSGEQGRRLARNQEYSRDGTRCVADIRIHSRTQRRGLVCPQDWQQGEARQEPFLLKPSWLPGKSQIWRGESQTLTKWDRSDPWVEGGKERRRNGANPSALLTRARCYFGAKGPGERGDWGIRERKDVYSRKIQKQNWKYLLRPTKIRVCELQQRKFLHRARDLQNSCCNSLKHGPVLCLV